MTSKSRQIDVNKSYIGKDWFTVFGGPPQNVHQYYADLHGLETLVDTSPHPYGSGGNMTMLRSTVRSAPCYIDAATHTGGVDYAYSGAVFAHQYANNNPQTPQAILSSTMLGYGVKGWNRYKPTARNGSLAQAVIELRDVPKMLEHSAMVHSARERTKGILESAGGHYLNIQFGWLPLLNDVRDLVRNAFLVEKRLRQLERDNNKWVRRRGPLDAVTSTSTSRSTGFFSQPSRVSQLYQGNETQSITTRQVTRFWFSGKFRYYIKIPSVTDGVVKGFLKAEHVNRILYGTDLTPDLIWEIMPWSWLVDWFSSAGASMANFFEDSADNLVADYAYVMGNIANETEYVVSGKTNTGVPYETYQSYLTEVKQRTAGVPYGFYFIPPILSVKQIGILTALGLSRRVNGK
jgi:hypothetical protein